MKIHIICSRLHTDRVLQRLAKTLAKGTGWTLGERPDSNADVNYFFPYLELQRQRWTDTLSAAWFTHKDIATPKKMMLWDDVASRVDLRLTSTPMYLSDLERFGESHYVRVAVEREHFNIKPKQHGNTIGVSGWSYGDNRKGEDLIGRLAKSPVGRKYRWKASGRNWPLKTQTYQWDEMPAFFQSLDLFVFASRIEGPGMPPLEALSCGIPVVIPRNVGLMDEFPDVHGVYRFKAGNYPDLERAFTEAVEDKQPIDREALRETTAPYTAENWCADHEKVMDEFLYGFAGETLPSWEGNAGAYVVAFGEPSRKCAERCIKSLKVQMPKLPIALVGAKPLQSGEDVFIRHDDVDIGGRHAKLAVDKLAPADWKYILYLDADTEVKGPLDFVFKMLQSGWEFLICKDMTTRHYLRMMQRGDNKVEYDFTVKEVGTDQVLQYNGGFFAFRRCNRTKRFWEIVNEEYEKWAARDQGALVRALYRHPLRMFVLGNQWNASTRYELPPGPLAVLHHNMQARRWGRSIAGRIDGKDAWQAVKEWEMAQK